MFGDLSTLFKSFCDENKDNTVWLRSVDSELELRNGGRTILHEILLQAN